MTIYTPAPRLLGSLAPWLLTTTELFHMERIVYLFFRLKYLKKLETIGDFSSRGVMTYRVRRHRSHQDNTPTMDKLREKKEIPVSLFL